MRNMLSREIFCLTSQAKMGADEEMGEVDGSDIQMRSRAGRAKRKNRNVLN
jgi:hypothetical protein